MSDWAAQSSPSWLGPAVSQVPNPTSPGSFEAFLEEQKKKRQAAIDSQGEGSDAPEPGPADLATNAPQVPDWKQDAIRGAIEGMNNPPTLAKRTADAADRADQLNKQAALFDVHKGMPLLDVNGQPQVDAHGKTVYDPNSAPHPSLFRKIASTAAGVFTGALTMNPMIGMDTADQIKYGPQYQEQASLFQRNKVAEEGLKGQVDVAQAQTQAAMTPVHRATAVASLINAAGKGTPKPGQLVKVSERVGPDNKKYITFRNPNFDTAQPVSDTNPLTIETEGEDVRNQPLRGVAGAQLSVTDAAQAISAPGVDPKAWMFGPTNKPLTPEDIQRMGVNEKIIMTNDGKWWPASQVQTDMIADNQVGRGGQLNPASQFTSAGLANVGSTSSAPVPGMVGPGGGVVMGQTTTVPNAGASPFGQGQAAPQRPQPVAPQSAPQGQPTGPVAATPARPGALARPGQEVPNTFAPAVRDQAIRDSREVRIGSQWLVGSPDAPGKITLANFADLADDKAAQSRIATALTFLRDNHNGGSHGGDGLGLNVAGMGASVDSGGLWQLFKNWSGLAGTEVSQGTKPTITALNAMSPRERQYVATVMNAMEDMTAGRGLVGSSAYEFAVKLLQGTLPTIGINSVDSKTYRQQLGQSLGIYTRSIGSIPDVFLSEDPSAPNAANQGRTYRAWLAQKQHELEGGTQLGATKAPAPVSKFNGRNQPPQAAGGGKNFVYDPRTKQMTTAPAK